jgi:phospholipase C
MRRRAALCLSVMLVCTLAIFLTLNGCGGGGSSTNTAPAPAPATGKIEHVVIIFQENRTPDNLFHDPVLIANGADIASSGLDSSGASIPLTATPLGVDYDLSHAHSGFLAMYDGGKMDGANNVTISCSKGATDCPLPQAQYKYVQSSDVTPYFAMAEQYTFGDRMFQTNEGPSFPAHQFIISGTSAPTATSDFFVSENPQGVPGAGSETGCTAPPAEWVVLIDPSGSESSQMYPCMEHPTLTDGLNSKGISWRYYAPSAGSIWTAPNAIQHMCGPNAAPPNATACVGSDWVNNVVLYTTQNPAPILTDISNNQLPVVSWVIPSGQNSDHAGSLADVGGPSWVAAIVNAIGISAYWSNTAIIIAWDDWGGWYDHVPPAKIVNNGTSWGSGYVYGFRVPLIVISPYAKAKYISHVTHDFGSILNLIEKTFGLPSLGYADAYADDLSDCFDLNQTPLTFQTIAAPMNAQHFLKDHTPATDPDDD